MTGRRVRRKKEKQNRFSTVLIIMVILMMAAFFSFKCYRLKEKSETYAAREAELREEIAKEEERSTEIEEYGKYTQTKKYVEEVAKEKLGLVNENEIIFKEE